MWEPVALCCFSRRTGCLVLGSLEVIGAILGFIGTVYGFARELTDVNEACAGDSATSFCDRRQESATFAYSIMAVLMIYSVLQCIFSSMMIHGVRTNNHCLMAPFLIKNLILIVLYIIACCIGVAVLCVFDFFVMIAFAYCHGAIIFMWTYFLLTVRAHHYELKRGTAGNYKKLLENCHLEHGQTNKV